MHPPRFPYRRDRYPDRQTQTNTLFYMCELFHIFTSLLTRLSLVTLFFSMDSFYCVQFYYFDPVTFLLFLRFTGYIQSRFYIISLLCFTIFCRCLIPYFICVCCIYCFTTLLLLSLFFLYVFTSHVPFALLSLLLSLSFTSFSGTLLVFIVPVICWHDSPRGRPINPQCRSHSDKNVTFFNLRPPTPCLTTNAVYTVRLYCYTGRIRCVLYIWRCEKHFRN